MRSVSPGQSIRSHRNVCLDGHYMYVQRAHSHIYRQFRKGPALGSPAGWYEVYQIIWLASRLNFTI